MSAIIPVFSTNFAANSYFVTADGKRAVAIDPALPSIAVEAERRGLNVVAVLLTHGHFDHIGGCAALQRSGATIGCSAQDAGLALHRNLGPEFGHGEVPPFHIDFPFGDGDVLTLAGVELRVLATPGHTTGSCCFLAGDALFSGDTLFCGDIGRMDLPTGSPHDMQKSLQRLCALEQNYTVYPGHGVPTTLDAERLPGGGLRLL